MGADGNTIALQEPPTETKVNVRELFELLTETWKNDSQIKLSSDPCAVLKNPAYQYIIRMGTKVLPLIFEDYQKEIDHWAPALHMIVGSNPIKKSHAGRPVLMREDWLAWARKNGYLK